MSSKKQNKTNTKKSGNSAGGYKGPKGDEESLGYNVFDYGRLNHNQYNKTLEAILSLIGQTYSQPGNTITSIRQGARVNIPDILTPAYEDETTGDVAQQRAGRAINRTLDIGYVESLKNRSKEIQTLKANIESAFSLVWGQCTPSMQA